ncbi:MAG: molybdenum cofactor guanylyltransferase [Terracidiphilus sp.]
MNDYLPSQPDATGFILAGGHSSRMGRDKALLEFAGRLLIVHTLAILEQAGLPAAIAGAAPSARAPLGLFAPLIQDSAPGKGPLSGICAALASTSARYEVFLPVDLPFLPPPLLVVLVSHARATRSAVTVPSVSGFAQTFPAVVDRAALTALQNELNAGRSGCFSAFQAAAAALNQPFSAIAVEPLLASGQLSDPRNRAPADWFLNLNTPTDLARAEALHKTP